VERPVFRRAGEIVSRYGFDLSGKRYLLSRAAGAHLGRIANRLEGLETKLKTLSPLAVLERGYSITFERSTGKVVRSSDKVDVGDGLNIRLKKGTLDAEVTGKE
jgi:exodeoxyribonuclease VII large subunit